MQTYTTQMDAARKGIVTPQMETVAKKEYRTVEEIRQLVAEGKVAIPANKHHTCLDPEGIGSMLRTKINVNLGVSRDCKDYSIEMQKVMSAVNMGAEAIMDLSSHGNTQPFRQKLTHECPVMIGTVPVYDSVIHYQRDLATLTAQDFIDVVRLHAEDGVDFVPMRGWKNSLINLLNIAGTGPILGPIQGILFGPIAFLTIPIGNIIGGAMHDYFSGMICLRDGGTQMPEMIRRYSTKGIYKFYNVFVCVLLLLVGAVFIYTPGDIAATQLFGFDGKATSVSTWVIYGVIFLYYLIATVFPIDAIIGKIYPIFGGILLFSAIGIFIGIFVTGMPLMNIWDGWAAPVLSLTGADGTVGTFTYADYFSTKHFLPIFFVTVACGILSGFHSTQTAIISRTMNKQQITFQSLGIGNRGTFVVAFRIVLRSIHVTFLVDRVV